MSERDQRMLVKHGALVFLVGMAAGFPFAIEILGRFELWPLPIHIEMDMPGDYRGWRMAHMEGVLNGLLLIGVAAVGSLLRLGPRGAAWVTRGLLVCAWGNVTASWIGPLSETRGLSFDGIGWNSLVYLLFVAAIVGVVGAMWNVWLGAREGVGKGAGDGEAG
jgi:hypothetical protein